MNYQVYINALQRGGFFDMSPKLGLRGQEIATDSDGKPPYRLIANHLGGQPFEVVQFDKPRVTSSTKIEDVILHTIRHTEFTTFTPIKDRYRIMFTEFAPHLVMALIRVLVADLRSDSRINSSWLPNLQDLLISKSPPHKKKLSLVASDEDPEWGTARIPPEPRFAAPTTRMNLEGILEKHAARLREVTVAPFPPYSAESESVNKAQILRRVVDRRRLLGPECNLKNDIDDLILQISPYLVTMLKGKGEYETFVSGCLKTIPKIIQNVYPSLNENGLALLFDILEDQLTKWNSAYQKRKRNEERPVKNKVTPNLQELRITADAPPYP